MAMHETSPLKQQAIPLLFLALLACNPTSTRPIEQAIKSITPYSDQAFVDAIMRGDSDQIDAFLAQDYNPNATNRFGDSALHWAIYSGRIELARTLLDRGADPNSLGTDAKSPLFWSARRGDAQATALLLQRGALTNLRDKRGSSPLHHAAFSGDLETVGLLNRKNSPILLNQAGDTPLHIAIEESHPDCLRRMVEEGADLYATNGHGTTALAAAIQHNYQQVLLGSEIIQKRYPKLAAEIESLLNTVIENEHEQPRVNFSRVALLVHEKVNQFRRQQGLEVLAYDEALKRIAAAHSRDMAARGYIAHVNPEGQDPTERAQLAGYPISTRLDGGTVKMGIGENIYQGHLYRSSAYSVESGTKYVKHAWLTEDQLAEAAVQGWKDSPGHRKNLLTDHYQRQGIGLALADDGKLFITQNLW